MSISSLFINNKENSLWVGEAKPSGAAFAIESCLSALVSQGFKPVFSDRRQGNSDASRLEKKRVSPVFSRALFGQTKTDVENFEFCVSRLVMLPKAQEIFALIPKSVDIGSFSVEEAEAFFTENLSEKWQPCKGKRILQSIRVELANFHQLARVIENDPDPLTRQKLSPEAKKYLSQVSGEKLN